MKQVVIYSGPGCSACAAAKDFFQSNHIEYIEFNIQEDSAAMKFLRNRKISSIPYILIGDSEIIGFDVDRIKNELWGYGR